MAELALERGFEVLILTNAMAPMMRPRVQAGLLDLNARFGNRLTLRVSMDHFTSVEHDQERGVGTWDKTLAGMAWLRDAGIQMHIAGRAVMEETESAAREGFAALCKAHGFGVDCSNPGQLILFPEMDLHAEVPEITTACWDILGKTPDQVMCSHSRMVVRRKGAERPTVIACTLLPYDPRFDMGETLKAAEGDVSLNHPHCAKFCVLGGASCSA
jgi:MoaA/NifB/PqqE/SkfB family radical SAM enzyme